MSAEMNEKHEGNALQTNQKCFALPFAYPSRNLRGCDVLMSPSRYPSRTLRVPSRTAAFLELHLCLLGSFALPFAYPSRNLRGLQDLGNSYFRSDLLPSDPSRAFSETLLVFVSKRVYDGSHMQIQKAIALLIQRIDAQHRFS